MRGDVVNIEPKSLTNPDFRHVLSTAPHRQLVVMTLQAGEDIGLATHPTVHETKPTPPDPAAPPPPARANQPTDATMDGDALPLPDDDVIDLGDDVLDPDDSGVSATVLLAPQSAVFRTKA